MAQLNRFPLRKAAQKDNLKRWNASTHVQQPDRCPTATPFIRPLPGKLQKFSNVRPKVDCHRQVPLRLRSEKQSRVEIDDEDELFGFEHDSDPSVSSIDCESRDVDDEQMDKSDQNSITIDDESTIFLGSVCSASLNSSSTLDDYSLEKPRTRYVDYGKLIAVRPNLVRSGKFTTIFWNFEELERQFEVALIRVPTLKTFILQELKSKGGINNGQLLIRKRKLSESTVIGVLKNYAQNFSKVIFASLNFNQITVDKINDAIGQNTDKTEKREREIMMSILRDEDDREDHQPEKLIRPVVVYDRFVTTVTNYPTMVKTFIGLATSTEPGDLSYEHLTNFVLKKFKCKGIVNQFGQLVIAKKITDAQEIISFLQEYAKIWCNKS